MTETIICDCGMLIKGTTQKHLKENLRKHLKGRKHKELKRFKKISQNKNERDNHT